LPIPTMRQTIRPLPVRMYARLEDDEVIRPNAKRCRIALL